jgi:hypothetical protein
LFLCGFGGDRRDSLSFIGLGLLHTSTLALLPPQEEFRYSDLAFIFVLA